MEDKKSKSATNLLSHKDDDVQHSVSKGSTILSNLIIESPPNQRRPSYHSNLRLSSRSLSPQGESPSRSVSARQQSPLGSSVVPYSDIEQVLNHLLTYESRAHRAIYLSNNSCFVNIPKQNRKSTYQRFIDILSLHENLHTLSMKRSFVDDELIECLMNGWLNGRISKHLNRINLESNIITTNGLLRIAQTLSDERTIEMSSSLIHIWLKGQMKPADSIVELKLRHAIQCNDRIVFLGYTFRNKDIGLEIEKMLKQRTAYVIDTNENINSIDDVDLEKDRDAKDMEQLKSIFSEIISESPNLRQFELDHSHILGAMPHNERVKMTIGFLNVLCTNTMLHRLVLSQNLLTDEFTNSLCDTIAQGILPNLRILILDHNCLSSLAIEKITSLLMFDQAFDLSPKKYSEHTLELNYNQNMTLPLQILKLDGQMNICRLDETIAQRILERLILNKSLIELSIDWPNSQFDDQSQIFVTRNLQNYNRKMLIVQNQALDLKSSINTKTIVDDESMSDYHELCETIDDVLKLIARQTPRMKFFRLFENPFLRCLSVSDAAIASRSLLKLLVQNEDLHEISLVKCSMNDAFAYGFHKYVSVGRFSNVRHLRLDQNGLTFIGIQSLMKILTNHEQQPNNESQSTHCLPLESLTLFNQVAIESVPVPISNQMKSPIEMDRFVLNVLEHNHSLKRFTFDFNSSSNAQIANQIILRNCQESN